MLTDVEEVVVKELKGLCGSCMHAFDCVYRKTSDKVVIQCEVFEDGDTGTTVDNRAAGEIVLRGLCLNCNKNRFCHLPKKTSGVWHCEEYE